MRLATCGAILARLSHPPTASKNTAFKEADASDFNSFLVLTPFSMLLASQAFCRPYDNVDCHWKPPIEEAIAEFRFVSAGSSSTAFMRQNLGHRNGTDPIVNAASCVMMATWSHRCVEGHIVFLFLYEPIKSSAGCLEFASSDTVR
jgi:hypothetical protein